MKKYLLPTTILIILSLLLSACNFAGKETPPDEPRTDIPITGGPDIKPTPGKTETANPKLEYWDIPIIETHNNEDLMEFLEKLLSENPGMYGLSLRDFNSDLQISIRDSEQYPTGEFCELAVNLYLFSQVEKGNVNLDDTVVLTESDILSTDEAMDGYGVGSELSLMEISSMALRKQDKTAVKILERHLGQNNINEYLETLGTKHTLIPVYSSPKDTVILLNEINRLYEQNPDIYDNLANFIKREDSDFTLTPPTKGDSKLEVYGIEGITSQLLTAGFSAFYKGDRGYALSIMVTGSETNSAIQIADKAAKAIYGFLEYGILPEYEINSGEMIYNKIIEGARPGNFGYFEETLVEREVVKNYMDDKKIKFPKRGEYANDFGLSTFRGDNYRSGSSYGTADINEEKLEIIWDFNIGSISTQSGGYWPGVGWTGQPSIIKWDPKTSTNMNIKDKFKGTDFKEVIYGSLDGNIYFCDLETGEWTRDPIHIGYPTKGSVSVDPRGYPLLFTGQGIGENGTETLTPRFRIFNLMDQSLLFEINGDDPDCFRQWPNFDSSGLLDIEKDTYYQMGENGIVYKIELNTQYNQDTGDISINPEVIKYRYLNPFGPNIGIESSPAIYERFLYFTDNNGLVACIDLNNLRALWIAGTGDDTDATPVLDETEEGVFLYTGTEVDIIGAAGGSASGEYPAVLSKFNALTGELIWKKEYDCRYNSVINGGVLGTPVVGRNEIDNIVIYPLAKYGGEYMGKLVALDKQTGEEIWSLDSEAYSWSSPTAVYTPDGKAYILYCNFAGNMYLIEGKTGIILDTISVGANVEGSPGVYENIAVIGSYAKKIFGVRIK